MYTHEIHMLVTWQWFSVDQKPQNPYLDPPPQKYQIRQRLRQILTIYNIGMWIQVKYVCQSPGFGLDGMGSPQNPCLDTSNVFVALFSLISWGGHWMAPPFRTSWFWIPSDIGLSRGWENLGLHHTPEVIFIFHLNRPWIYITYLDICISLATTNCNSQFVLKS